MRFEALRNTACSFRQRRFMKRKQRQHLLKITDSTITTKTEQI